MLNKHNTQCCYVVSEQACLYPFTGAGRHIQTGLEQLSRSFNVNLVTFCRPLSDEAISLALESGHAASKMKGGYARRFFGSWIRWWLILFQNHKNFIKHYRVIRKEAPRFIYERAAYLNYTGLLISKIMRIPHFYEVNGIYYRDNETRFPSLYNTFARIMERKAYKSTSCFFVGGLNHELGIPESSKSYVIQNGIDASFLEVFKMSKSNPDNHHKVNILFVGHAMPHHRFDILVQAIAAMRYKERVTLHLVGSNFEQYLDDLYANAIGTEQYGVLGHSELVPILHQMDIGVVPFAEDYYSNMKVFLYGAAGLAVVLPMSRNFLNIFSHSEAVFFENMSIRGLSAALDDIVVNRAYYRQMGHRCRDKIAHGYTWDRIFDEIIKRIQEIENSALA